MSCVLEHLADERSGVLVIDETGFVKKGTKSAGVARQYSGTAGRRENQQIGVFLLYTSDRGAAFIDRGLYLPDEWMGDAERREEARIPAQVGFATKGELARALLARTFAAGVPARWVVGDTVYSGDEVRRWLEGQGRSYVLAVPSTHGIWTRAHQQTVEHVVQHQVPADAWVRLSAGAGSQGPRWYDGACLHLPYATPAGKAQWLLARRSITDPSELAYSGLLPSVWTGRHAGHRDGAGGGEALDHRGRLRAGQRRGGVGPVRGAPLRRLAPTRHARPLGPCLPRGHSPERAGGRNGCRSAHSASRGRAAWGGASANRAELIALTVPEVRRLLLLLAAPEDAEREHHLRWSLWRRRHQAVARRGHRARRAHRPPPAQPGPATPGPIPVLVVPGTAEYRRAERDCLGSDRGVGAAGGSASGASQRRSAAAA